MTAGGSFHLSGDKGEGRSNRFVKPIEVGFDSGFVNREENQLIKESIMQSKDNA
jgi:hypothetical protein